jgi:glycosyltransferase involved in cell wall biosynthesis
VVLLPSRWDNFPTVLLESMSYGKAVVASPHGGMVEMLQDTLCSVAEPESDKFIEEVARFLRSDVLRKDVGRSMFDKACRAYAPDVVAAAYLDFVEKQLRAW